MSANRKHLCEVQCPCKDIVHVTKCPLSLVTTSSSHCSVLSPLTLYIQRDNPPGHKWYYGQHCSTCRPLAAMLPLTRWLRGQETKYAIPRSQVDLENHNSEKSINRLPLEIISYIFTLGRQTAGQIMGKEALAFGELVAVRVNSHIITMP